MTKSPLLEKIANTIFLPTEKPIDEPLVWQWYLNMSRELDIIDYSEFEKRKIKDYYEEAGLFRGWRQGFFRRHYSHSFTKAAQYLAPNERATDHILDLGCGTGAQSLFFALRGAKITGIDMDEEALEIFRKRISYYEGVIDRKLDIELVAGNCFDIDYKELGPIDGVYSMFAFNMMQPSQKLVEKLVDGLSNHARMAIIDGNNNSWLTKLVPSRRRDVWSPKQFADALERLDFSVYNHQGAVSLPPVLWTGGVEFLCPVDNLLNKSWFFSLSHQILAEIII